MTTDTLWSRENQIVHLLAILTMVSTLVLLYVGGLVTSYEVGMAVPDWPTTFNENPITYSFLDKWYGIILEHSHRLLGGLIGVFTLALAAAIYVVEKRAWVRWLGLVAVVGVITQGVLGGQRVELNEWAGQDLAALHGCFGQAFFAFTAALATITSRSWIAGTTIASASATGIQRGSVILAATVYMQIVLGAIVRHYEGWGWMIHMSIALAVFFLAMWMGMLLFLEPPVRKVFGSAGLFLIGAIITQLVLGFLTLIWTGVLDPGSHTIVSNQEAIITTTHLALGSILLGVSVYLALSTRRRLANSIETPQTNSTRAMESVA